MFAVHPFLFLCYDKFTIFLLLRRAYIMIALKFQSTKNFMAHLLLLDTFDQFSFIEGEIVTFARFTIDGFSQKEFFSPQEEVPPYCSWQAVREFCYSLIKGKRTPVSFKLIFSLSPKNITRLVAQNGLDFAPENIQGLYLNIQFEDGLLKCVTGTSLKIFSMDKSLEKTWDIMVQKFFHQKGISYEPIN